MTTMKKITLLTAAIGFALVPALLRNRPGRQKGGASDIRRAS